LIPLRKWIAKESNDEGRKGSQIKAWKGCIAEGEGSWFELCDEASGERERE
jgi:hypothetical protein